MPVKTKTEEDGVEYKVGQFCYTLLDFDSRSLLNLLDPPDKDLTVVKAEIIGIHKEMFPGGQLYIHYDVQSPDYEGWTAHRKSYELFKTKKAAHEYAEEICEDRIFQKRRIYEMLGKQLEKLGR